MVYVVITNFSFNIVSFSVYPTMLTSVRFRDSVYRETGHTIMNLLAVSIKTQADRGLCYHQSEVTQCCQN